MDRTRHFQLGGEGHFKGYHRSDGRVGTQNVWLVVPLVFCENRNIHVMREAVAETLGVGQRSRYESLFI